MNWRLTIGRTVKSSRMPVATATTTWTGNEAPRPAATAPARAPPANMMNTKSTVAASTAASTRAIPSQASQKFSVSQSMV